MNLEQLKIKRRGLRTSFTMCGNKIEKELSGEAPNYKELLVLKSQFKDKFDRLSECQEDVSKGILDSELEKNNFDADLEEAELYRDRFCAIVSSIDTFGFEIASVKEEKRKFKLPKIELKKFTGDAKEYLSFWSQFEKIHLDDSLPAEDKFQYLIQSVVPGSKAARLVESFPATAPNYEKAIQQLRERFGREDLLVQIYVRELLSMVMKNAVSGRSKTDLPALYDELEGKLRALESLGRTQEKYGDFLTPLVESCLPEDILIAWERSRNKSELSSTDDRNLRNLMSFIKQEVIGEEMVVLARTGFGANCGKKKSHFTCDSSQEIHTAAALVSTNQDSTGRVNIYCLFCSKKHLSQDCFLARKLSYEEKKKIIAKKGACFCCLKPGHMARQCRYKTKCIHCNRNHFILMCPEREASTNENKNEVPKNALIKNDVDSTNALINSDKSETVFLMTLIVKIKNRNYERKVRALVDTGSQLSYLSKRIINDLKLKPKRKCDLVHNLFGGTKSEPKSHEMYEIEIFNLENTFSIKIDVLSENKICGIVPKLRDRIVINELRSKNILLPDLNSKEYEIELLIGADVSGLIMTENSLKLSSGLIVFRTKLGPTIIGKENSLSVNCYNSDFNSETFENVCISNVCYNNVVSMLSLNIGVHKLWDLDVMGITDPWENANKKLYFKESLELFQNNLNVLPNGRYELKLPFKNEMPLSDNKNSTVRRHKNMCKRAERGSYLKDYIEVFNEWEKMNIIEKVPESEINLCGHYLPHRPVIKKSSETFKIRPVFDASFKDENLPSLNDCLINGPNLMELIPDIIDRFRLYPIGLSADIEKAFLQLSVAPEHRNFLRFFFPSETNDLQVYRHCRVVFGVKTSPFMLMASLHHLFENAPAKYSDIMPKLRHSFYVDNCLTGVNNINELENFVSKTQELMKGACFNLRKWEGNVYNKYLSNCTGQTLILGLIWNLDQDNLYCSVPDKIMNEKACTKRTLLSAVQRIFDPLGFLCPATLLPKLLLQEAWRNKLAWDDTLPSSIENQFLNWLKQVSDFSSLRIPRYLETNSSSELHVFADARRKSYGACVFMRTITYTVKVQFIRAKSRVAPLKDISIPRLELLACCVGARLAKSIRAALDLPEIKTIFWSDSMVALWWICNRGEWSIFVSNRVKEINAIAPSENWRHVPGALNPADIISRGCSPKQLLNSKWLDGPPWLLENSHNWPSNEIFCSSEVNSESRKVTVNSVNLEEETIPWYAKKFSAYQSIIRLVAWVFRFVNNLKVKSGERNLQKLSLLEIEAAEKFLIKEVQTSFFVDPRAIPVLNTFHDEDGIIRVKTRITMRIDTPYFISPVLLPDKCIFTKRLIEHLHKVNCHAGTQILLNIIREKFWIVRGRKAVGNIVKNCIKCERFKAKSLLTEPVALPADRVKDANVFEVIGVDLAGPLYLKKADKAWVVIFTCAIYRAIHMEIVISLSTDSFLLALRRFIARRGRPRIVYSDNGTNFKGAFNCLSHIDWDKVSHEAELYRIIWRFNPPTAAWWGGWWERLVRTLKELLRRTLGRAVLNYEELQTAVCDCESVMNSRPLTYLSEDSDDLVPISPAMFLIEKPESRVTDIDTVDSTHFRKRIRYRMRLVEELRTRFRKEYLSQLLQQK